LSNAIPFDCDGEQNNSGIDGTAGSIQSRIEHEVPDNDRSRKRVRDEMGINAVGLPFKAP